MEKRLRSNSTGVRRKAAIPARAVSVAFFVLAACVFMLAPPWAGKASAEPRYSGTLSAVMETYKTVEGDTAFPAYLYLSLSADEPMKLGSNNYFYLYGRLAQDLGADDGRDSRLYAAFWNIRGLPGDVDLRVGRQFYYNVAGFTLLDGVEARFNRVAKFVDVEVFGGGDVKFEERYKTGDAVYGGSADLVGVKDVTAGVSYMKKTSGWNDDREALGFKAGYRYKDYGRIDGEARYDFFSESTDYYNISAKGYLTGNTTASLSYTYNLPIFDADSIYSVFAAEEYSELVLGLEQRITNSVSVFGSYTNGIYKEGNNNNVYELGGKYSHTSGMSLEASLISQQGYDDLLGWRLVGRFGAGSGMTYGAGVERDAYTRFDMPGEEATSLVFADVRYDRTKKNSFYMRVEDRNSVLSDNEVRATVRVSYAFDSKE